MSDSAPVTTFAHTPFVPHDPTALMYTVFGGCAVPVEYNGWRDEAMSWKKSAYLHGHLNPTPTYRVSGPAALDFLRDNCVNSFAKFNIGGSKHAVMCNDAGQIMAHGMVLRLAEEEFITYWLSPYLQYRFEHSDYDAVGEDLTGNAFLFQLAGPKSLEILEAATGEDMRDIRFLRHRPAKIGGIPVNILRVGMAGSLAYEAHGPIESAYVVNDALFEAGQIFGIQRLGTRGYFLNHTENGFPQSWIHFAPAWNSDPRFMKYHADSNAWWKYVGYIGTTVRTRGSAGSEPQTHFRTPIELGWSNIVKFDHDFPGSESLRAEMARPKRTMVTLEWNADDIVDVYASQFQPGEPYLEMPIPMHYRHDEGDPAVDMVIWADKVMCNGKQVGVSSGRLYTEFYRRMISLCSLDVEHAQIGNEVTVLWGEPGTRQKQISAKVARFPYLDLPRNENIDVTTLPKAQR